MDERFGDAVDIDGKTIIIGAHYKNGGATGKGAAYIFKRSGTKWTQFQKLQPADVLSDDHFGNAVAISGGTLVIAAYQDAAAFADQGSVYIFDGPPTPRGTVITVK